MRLPARRSDTTLCNSGWENYQQDDPTQHLATLADRTRREIFRHNTLELCRREAKRSDTKLKELWLGEWERDDPRQYSTWFDGFDIILFSDLIGSEAPRKLVVCHDLFPLSFSRIRLDRSFPWGTKFAPQSITPSCILHVSHHQMEYAVKRQE